ncbi:Centromere/kinetochore Zw10-domain-containing protein, partial [Phycomyces blakesleeanus]
LKNLGQILDFCFENLCGADLDHARLFGNLALPELFGLVIEKVLGPAIPTTSKDLGTFGAVSRAAESLEQTSRDHFGWSEKENSLKEYVSHLDRHFARKRGEKVLLEGRNVMLRRLYDVEDAEEEEEKKEKEGEGMGKAGTETQHYRITQTPQLLVLLLTDMIQEASGLVNTHPISAAHLVHATADLLDLYRAIMPSYHRAHLIARPANCLVFRNDCFWIARQLQHKLDLAKRLCDEAEQLRLLGNWWAQLAFEQQMHRINLLLERLDGFVTIADHRQRQQCDEAIGGIIGQVRNFSDEARPVLDRRLFVETMARLVDRLLIRLIRMIEDIVDIGAEESELISRSLNSVAQLVSTFDLPGHDATEPEVMARVGSWQKFWLLKDMLEMTMKDIMEAWRRGSLGMFTVEEMCSLVCALFADTDRREAVLDEIKSGR